MELIMHLAILAVWTMHTIAPADATWKGADGVAVGDLDLDGDLDVVTPWEQGDRISIALNPGDPTQAWAIIALVGVGAVEDTAVADVDADGCPDVGIASESKHVWVAFQNCDGGAPHPERAWDVIELPGSAAQRWLKVAIADLDGDGNADVIGGGKHVAGVTGTAGTIEVWTFAQAPRSAASWTRTTVAAVGWCMTLRPLDVDGDGDLDLLASDRKGAALASSQKGSWWYEQAAGWTPHHIAHIAGDAGDLAVLEIGGAPTAIVDGNRTALWTRRPWASGWLAESIPFPADVGDFHAAALGDVDADGAVDLVLTFALTAASGVVWLRGPTWERQEISGPIGHKYDNAVVVDLDGDGDLDVITSEGGDTYKGDDLGVVWFEHP